MKPANINLTCTFTKFWYTRISRHYAPLILAPAEGSFLEPDPIDLHYLNVASFLNSIFLFWVEIFISCVYWTFMFGIKNYICSTYFILFIYLKPHMKERKQFINKISPLLPAKPILKCPHQKVCTNEERHCYLCLAWANRCKGMWAKECLIYIIFIRHCMIQCLKNKLQWNMHTVFLLLFIIKIFFLSPFFYFF